MRVPTTVFPSTEDLANPSFFYSGIYEEGWLSQRATLTLQSLPGQNRLHLGGYLPVIEGDEHYTTGGEVFVDGNLVLSRRFKIGEFDLAPKIALMPGKHQVVLNFERVRHLPGNDGRPVTMFLECVGFEKTASTKASSISNC